MRFFARVEHAITISEYILAKIGEPKDRREEDRTSQHGFERERPGR